MTPTDACAKGGQINNVQLLTGMGSAEGGGGGGRVRADVNEELNFS